MKVSIRKSKHQKEQLNCYQMRFGSECIYDYMKLDLNMPKLYHDYSGSYSCDVYRTKTQISAVVYFK